MRYAVLALGFHNRHSSPRVWNTDERGMDLHQSMLSDAIWFSFQVPLIQLLASMAREQYDRGEPEG